MKMRNGKTKLLITKVLIGCFLVGVFRCSLYASEGGDLMDELVSAINSHDHVKAKEASERLINMGDAAMPLLKRGLTLENKPLQSRILKILNQTKTANSTKIILDFATREKDKYMVRAAIEALCYPERDIAVEVDEKVLNFFLAKVQEGEFIFAPLSARILGKMRQVDPKLRSEACISALKKEVSRESDANTPQQILPGAYVTEPQYKIRQFIFALEDIGTTAVPYISRVLDTTSDKNHKEYLTICLCLAGGKKTPSTEVKSEIVRIAKRSSNGYIRALGIRILGEWEDKTLITLLKDALNDNFKVAGKPDVVTPDMRKGINGRYYFDYYPVRSEAFSALRKLGIKIKREGNKFTVEE